MENEAFMFDVHNEAAWTAYNNDIRNFEQYKETLLRRQKAQKAGEYLDEEDPVIPEVLEPLPPPRMDRKQVKSLLIVVLNERISNQ